MTFTIDAVEVRIPFEAAVAICFSAVVTSGYSRIFPTGAWRYSPTQGSVESQSGSGIPAATQSRIRMMVADTCWARKMTRIVSGIRTITARNATMRTADSVLRCPSMVSTRIKNGQVTTQSMAEIRIAVANGATTK